MMILERAGRWKRTGVFIIFTPSAFSLHFIWRMFLKTTDSVGSSVFLGLFFCLVLQIAGCGLRVPNPGWQLSDNCAGKTNPRHLQSNEQCVSYWREERNLPQPCFFAPRYISGVRKIFSSDRLHSCQAGFSQINRPLIGQCLALLKKLCLFRKETLLSVTSSVTQPRC